MRLGKDNIPFADSIRQNDPDRFLAATLLPFDSFQDALILLAFYHEIAQVRDKIRTRAWDKYAHNGGMIWWKDVLQASLFQHLF